MLRVGIWDMDEKGQMKEGWAKFGKGENQGKDKDGGEVIIYRGEAIIYRLTCTSGEKPVNIVIHPTYISFSFSTQLAYSKFKALTSSLKWLALEYQEFEQNVYFNKNRINIKRQSVRFADYIKLLIKQFFQKNPDLAISLQEELNIPHCAWTRDIVDNYIIYRNHHPNKFFNFITLHKQDNRIDKIILSPTYTHHGRDAKAFMQLQINEMELSFPYLTLDTQSCRIKTHLTTLAQVEKIPLASICHDMNLKPNNLYDNFDFLALYKSSEHLTPEISNQKQAIFALHGELSPRQRYFQLRQHFLSSNPASKKINDNNWTRVAGTESISYESKNANQIIRQITLQTHSSQIVLTSGIPTNHRVLKLVCEKLFTLAETFNDTASLTDEFHSLVIDRKSPHFAQYFIEIVRIAGMSPSTIEKFSQDLQLYSETKEITDLQNLPGFVRPF